MRRSDFRAGTPSTKTASFSASVAAKEREIPKRRVRPTSRRSPAKPSGTGKYRRKLSFVTGANLAHWLRINLLTAHPEINHEHRGEDDSDIGNIANKNAVIDEVNYVPLGETGGLEEPVNEVSDRSPKQERKRPNPRPRRYARRNTNNDHRNRGGQK